MTLFWIVVVVLIVVLIGFTAFGIQLFKKTFYRRPYRKAPSREQAEEPMRLDPAWEPYREAFQEGKKYFCLADREQVEICSEDGLKLVGHLLWPEGVRQNGVSDLTKIKGFFLLMHGFHGTGYSNFGLVLPFYMSLGYALLIPDQRAHQESEGEYITFGIKERFDCRSWCGYLAGRFGQEMPIFLDGISMGATTVLMASALELPGNVRGVIADCGFTCPRDVIAHVLQNHMKLPLFPTLQLTGLLCRVLAKFNWEEYSAVDAMKEGKLPVLFLHGRADKLVPCYMTEQNFAACTAEKYVVYVDGAEHGLSYLVEQERCQRTLREFVERYQ